MPEPYNKVKEVERQVNEVKDVMHKNIATQLNNLEKAEVVQDQTDLLRTQAREFKKTSTAVKRKMWWKNCKLWVAIILVILLIAAAIAIPVAITSSHH